jgi:hypothetical protein
MITINRALIGKVAQHCPPRAPAPTAPPGTMLYLVQLARYRSDGSASYPGNRNERRTVLGYAQTHASVLLGMRVSEHQVGYVHRSSSPWDVLLTWIERAMGKAVGV